MAPDGERLSYLPGEPRPAENGIEVSEEKHRMPKGTVSQQVPRCRP
jgi:hypothetical protein